MLYVFRSRNSDSAKLLADGLEGDRLKIFENGIFRRREGGISIRPRRGDSIICWGEALPTIAGAKVLNGAEMISKFTAAQRLKAAGVPTIEVATRKPVVTPARPLIHNVNGGALTQPQARILLDQLTRFIGLTPPAPQNIGEWVARTNNHMGGHDLLNPPTNGDFFVKKENITEEYRLHIFNGKSIRAGVKKRREGANAHAWVRSYDGGWNICYEGFKSKKGMREIAIKAVEALGLQFGAVDLGKKADGTYIVLEVNRAPGLEGGTVTSYVNAIQGWLEAAA